MIIDLLRQIGRALIRFCRRPKPAESQQPGPIPLWVVLRMGDHAVMVLARHRGRGIEQWVWVWPLDQVKLLGRQLLLEAARPNYFADPRDGGRAWEYANKAGREWREEIDEES